MGGERLGMGKGGSKVGAMEGRMGVEAIGMLGGRIGTRSTKIRA